MGRVEVIESNATCCWILQGTHDGERYRFRLVEGGNSLGSRRQNRICLELSGISKHHATIRLSKGRLTAEDLASKNGTFVNGVRVQQASLDVGDVLGIGSLSLRLEQTYVEDGQLAISLGDPLFAGGESGLQETPLFDRARPSLRSSSDEAELVFPDFWLPGESTAMAELLSQMRSVCRSDLPVLVLGETGVGKEGVARTLHLSSRRVKGPFVAINCAAIPEELLEAELFGIGAGVATGVSGRDGRFLEARGGTLFLDEIGDMPVSLQAKLLRVLQEGEVQPLGQRAKVLDVRIVAATHDDLTVAMASGRFRRDLFYRLAGVALHLPSLRQRPEDIPSLVAHFLTDAAHAAGKDIRGLTVDAMRLAIEHPWPGNVRQLRHAVERWVHRCPKHQVVDAELVASDLACALGVMSSSPTSSSSSTGSSPQITSSNDEVRNDGNVFDPATLSSLDLASFEEQLIQEALRRTDGNLTKAALELGLSRQSLRRRLERHALRDLQGS